jgi:hypothetical protein
MKVQPPQPTGWAIYKVHHRGIWLGTVEALPIRAKTRD